MPSKALHANDNVASSEFHPTTPQMMEFYTQVGRGDITRTSFQAFIRGELVRKPKRATPEVTAEKKEDPIEALDCWCYNHLQLGGFGDELREMVLPFFNPAINREFWEPPAIAYAVDMHQRKDYEDIVTQAVFWKKISGIAYDSITKPRSERTNFNDKRADFVNIASEVEHIALAQEVRTRSDLNAHFFPGGGADYQFANLVWHEIRRKMEATGAYYYHLLQDDEINLVGKSVWMALRKMLAFYRVGDKERALMFAPFFKMQSSRWPVLYVTAKSLNSTFGYTTYALSY